MLDKIVILSDIHANLTALCAVLSDISIRYQPDAFVLLGDLVNYGMRPNEVIDKLDQLEYPLIVNLQGNHEKALLDNDLTCFSTERGKELLKYTLSILSEKSLSYIKSKMNPDAHCCIELAGKRLLFVHGDMDNPFWGKLTADKTNDIRYGGYDYVFSGHTHLPHYIESYFQIDCPELRNKKKTVFINPGSVGQPRNQNPCAQYVYLELHNNQVHYNSVSYSVETERSLYPKQIDVFYRDRLLRGV